MAIKVVYGVDPALAGQVAVGAGQASYAQQEMTRQQELEFRLAQLAQRDRQFSAQQAQSGYQFEKELAANQLSREQQLAAQMYGQELQQMGYADMRDSEAAMQTERLEADKVKQRTDGEQRLIEMALEKEMQIGITSAQDIEKARREGKLRPGQYEQFREQWDTRYGEMLGPYPFDGNANPPAADDPMVVALDEKLRSYPGYYPGMAEDIKELPPPERAAFMLDVQKERAAALKAEETNRVTLEKERLKAVEAYKKKVDTNLATYHRALETVKKERMKFIDDGIDKLYRPPKPKTSTSDPDPGYEATADDIKDLQRRAERIYEIPDPTAYGLEPSEARSAAPAMPTSAPGSTRDNPVIVTHPSEIPGLPSKTYYKRPDGKIGYHK